MTPRPPTAASIEKQLVELGDPEDALFAQRYFKTGAGEYAEGDVFLGLRAPVMRKLSVEYQALPLRGCAALLRSRYHESRLIALLILVRKFARADEAERADIYRLYLDNLDHVNNWDLVDVSAPHIVGAYLEGRSRAVLTRMARSKSLWERRVAVLATLHFIRKGEFGDTFRVAEVLLQDEHDLIHKAVGWMLREVAKRDRPAAESFLKTRYPRMPRTMLRYAIERFPEPLRKRYLRGEV